MPQSFTIENSLPGVTALVNTAQVARPAQRQPSSTFFVVGYSPWGPASTPRVVTGWPDYVRQFGGFDTNSYLDDALYTFFNVFPGKQAVVCRVVGASAAVGTLTLKDRSASAGLDTVRVDAKYPSSRADIKLQVADGSAANTFKLIVSSVFFGFSETFDNLTVTAAKLDEVNQQSRLIKLTNMASATAAPGNNPRVLAATLLTGGNDDFAGLNAASYIGADSGTTKTGLQAFKDANLGGGQVAIPGLTADTIHAALIAHAEAYQRFALLDPPLASDKQAVATVRANYGTWHGAIHWPWVRMLDYEATGLKRFYPPSAFAAGACAKVDVEIGTHKAPANITIPGALDVERYSDGSPQIDDNTREYLNARDVNVIVPFVNDGVKIYGARVMAGSDKRVQMIHEARLLCLFYYSAKQAYAYAPFSVVDAQGRLFRDLRATGEAFLRGFWRDGALFGRKESEAFIVVADSSNNPSEELDAGRVRVDWLVKLSPTAEIVIVSVNSARLFQDLSVLQS